MFSAPVLELAIPPSDPIVCVCVYVLLLYKVMMLQIKTWAVDTRDYREFIVGRSSSLTEQGITCLFTNPSLYTYL